MFENKKKTKLEMNSNLVKQKIEMNSNMMKKNKDKDKVYINIISSFNHSNFVGLLKN